MGIIHWVSYEYSKGLHKDHFKIISSFPMVILLSMFYLYRFFFSIKCTFSACQKLFWWHHIKILAIKTAWNLGAYIVKVVFQQMD